MSDDDEPVGELLPRRRAIRLAGVPAVAWLAGCSTDVPTGTPTDGDAADPTGGPAETDTTTPTDTATPTDPATPTDTATPTPPGNAACVVRPRLTEGPFYSGDEDNPRRSDIRTDTGTGTRKEGVRLDLGLVASEMTDAGCEPLSGAIVDVWQADALGVYSDVDGAGTAGQDFLRGHQRTDDGGRAAFVTIYPGWYPGRTPHIHFQIRSPAGADTFYEFASQLFFTDERSTDVYDTYDPYASRDERDTYNEQDGIYQRSDGELTLDLVETDEGFEATMHVALHTS